jgi:LysR family transcriptional regulator, low CO2-responsive transcriptional regulator
MLNLYKLEIFAVVAREGSFSAAAEQLYMTQSAVSQHMQDLETSLGTRLFTRGRRGVKLTTSGEKLHVHTLDILRLIAQAENDVMDVSNLAEGQVKIGATPTVGIYLLPEWIKAFRQQYANLGISLQTATTADILNDLLHRRLDVGIVEGEIDTRQHPTIGIAPLREIRMNIVVGPEHPWWERDAIEIPELNQQPFAMRQPSSQTRIWLDALFEQYNIAPHITAEFDNPESIKQSVVSGRCLTVLPDYAVQRELELGLVRALGVENEHFTRILKLVWYAPMPLSPIATAFVEILSTEFPELELGTA